MKGKKLGKQSQHVRVLRTKRGKKRVVVNLGRRKRKVKKRFNLVSPEDSLKLLEDRSDHEGRIVSKIWKLGERADYFEANDDLDAAERLRNKVSKLEDKLYVDVRRSLAEDPVLKLGSVDDDFVWDLHGSNSSDNVKRWRKFYKDVGKAPSVEDIMGDDEDEKE